MLNLFNQYKWMALGTGVVVWSVGLWHVASTYTESTYTKERLSSLQKHVDTIQTMSKEYQDSLAALKPKVTTINKEIQREINTNTVYRDCKSTDGVLREYENKLDLQ